MNSELHRACSRGNFDTVKELLYKGCDVNKQDEDGWTPLHEASYWGDTSIGKLLIANGANVVNDWNEIPLHIACLGGFIDMAKLLVDEMLKSSITPQAIKEKIDTLIAGQGDIQTQFYRGFTALHYVAAWNATTLAVALLTKNASLDNVDTWGQVPLHKACLNGFTQVAKLLIDKMVEQ